MTGQGDVAAHSILDQVEQMLMDRPSRVPSPDRDGSAETSPAEVMEAPPDLAAAVIVSVNLVINLGVPGGYEAGTVEVFQHSPIGGVINAVIMIGGPALAAWLGWVIGRRATR